MATTKVSFKAKSGGDATGELALPEGSGRAPAVILFHEWWGLNDHIRTILDRLAKDGFVALAIDLYDGKTTKDAAEATKLMGALDFGQAIDRAAGAAEYLASHERGNGKVGVLGFCLGGALTFAAAANIPTLGAAVPFYGIPDASKVSYDDVKAPILAHFAARDEWAKPSLAEAVRDKLAASGKSMRLEIYDADHAFFNDTRPEVYSKDNAELAWTRTTEFLRANLG